MSTTVSHFISYKYIGTNNVLPDSLVAYCSKETGPQFYNGHINSQEIKNLLNSHMVKKNRTDDDKLLTETVMGYLNKLSDKNFPDMLLQFNRLHYGSKKQIYILAEKIAIKASSDQFRPELYAKLCKGLISISYPDSSNSGSSSSSNPPNTGPNYGSSFSFLTALLVVCQEMFTIKMGEPKKNTEYEKTHDYANIDSSGLMKFISELFNQYIIKDNIIYSCYTELLNKVKALEEPYYDPYCILCKTISKMMKLNNNMAFKKIKEDLTNLIKTSSFPKIQYKFKIQEVLDIYI